MSQRTTITMRRHVFQLFYSILFLITVSLSAHAGEGESFFRADDRWLLTGDSITFIDTYRETVERVMDHFHPDNRLTFPNRAVWGVPSNYKSDLPGKPTVVSIMLGMNDIIHHEWSHSPDFSHKLESYRNSMRCQIQRYQKIGAKVLLFTPTLTDERISSFFSPMYTREGLVKYGKILKELGKEENCLVLPVAEELEVYDDSLGPNDHPRPDGVHPYGEAQYQMAWTIIRYLNVRGKLTGRRQLSTPPETVPVRIRSLQPFLNKADEPIRLQLETDAPIQVVLTWSLASERGSESLNLKAGKTIWTLPASVAARTLQTGERRQAVIDLVSGKRQSLYILDLAGTRVLHPNKDGVVSGSITAPPKGAPFTHALTAFAGERPEGDLIGTFKIQENGPELWLSGRVYDQEICSDDFWITGRDNVRITMDFRKGSRFAALTPDRDTAMLLVAPRTKPVFSIMPLAWWGPRYQYTIHANGQRQKDGYSWLLGFAGHITDYTQFDIRKHDYYGFNMTIIDKDKKSFKLNSAMTAKYDINVEKGLNQLMIVDRKKNFPGDTTVTVRLFGK